MTLCSMDEQNKEGSEVSDCEAKSVPGLKAIAGSERRIVGMVQFQGELIVATEDGVWIKRGDVFVQLHFVDADAL